MIYRKNNPAAFTESTCIDEGTIFENVVFIHEAYKIPVKEFVNRIKSIKNSKPDSGTDAEELKKYVDKNYDKMIKCASILEKEPSDITKEEIKYLTGFLVIFLTSGISAAFGGLYGAILSIIMMTISSIGYIVHGTKVEKRAMLDQTTMNNLSKIKRGLQKQMSRDDVYKDTKSKIERIIDKIEDAECEYSNMSSL